jgi:hypothetical protein|tara:strand:+ start:714 stop:995 length:282 start_codon:yes stop_codon:yes gene_type:complete
MTPEDIAHKSVNRFVDKAFNKYMAGQSEHGGCLMNKSKSIGFFLDHIEEEVIDMWHYLQAFRIAHAGTLVDEKNKEDIEEAETMVNEELRYVV